MKYSLAGLLLLMSIAGCASITTNQRTVSLQDVIYLTRHELGPDVIIKHIEATESRFALTTEDIVQLKDAGVDEQVIEAMVERSGPLAPFAYENSWPPFASYGPLPGPRLYDYNYYPLYESYSGHYEYPSSIYGPQYQRRSGIIGRFYDYAPQPYPVRIPEDGARRDDSGGRTGDNGKNIIPDSAGE